MHEHLGGLAPFSLLSHLVLQLTLSHLRLIHYAHFDLTSRNQLRGALADQLFPIRVHKKPSTVLKLGHDDLLLESLTL